MIRKEVESKMKPPNCEVYATWMKNTPWLFGSVESQMFFSIKKHVSLDGFKDCFKVHPEIMEDVAIFVQEICFNRLG